MNYKYFDCEADAVRAVSMYKSEGYMSYMLKFRTGTYEVRYWGA